ncbi:hypothetical protein WQ54_26170 [Bacillus sp. SA1-12]|nr:hypothetical protein WQ54_26170 [Bacillus sp. SA1-12]
MLTAIDDDRDFFKQNYFKSSQFESEIDQLLNFINAFEISYQKKDEIKESLTVSQEEIENHRYQYGDLTEQISSIEQQYEDRINEALDNDNQKIADVYKKERDKKIDDITKNFESDEYIKNKIIAEKEQSLDDYYKELELFREDYNRYLEAFDYYLKNTATGEVYTNMPIKEGESVDDYFKVGQMRFIKHYPTKNNQYLELYPESLVVGYEEVVPYANESSNALFEGYIAVSKKTPSSNFLIIDYHAYENQKIVFWIYSIFALLSLGLCLFIGKNKMMLRKLAPAKWKELYDKLPIDVAFMIFGLTAIFTFLVFLENNYLYYSNDILEILENVFYQLIAMTGLLWLTIVQWFYLVPRVKALSSNREDWNQSLTMRSINIVRYAFLNRKVGTKVFLILLFVFSFGAGTIMIFVEELFLLFYIPAFFVIGIPLFIFIVKRTGYFNEILNHAHALAKGDFQPDLKVAGKSVFAKLAEDINTMKRGVKTSQKAQAKSERLKTELITNVSHDLRTPLTSIITYSELLKNQKITEDERKAYIEIIDRKSKRLKVLIDDLFEASKMASGNIELVKERIDLVQLLQQALAESNEAIQDSGIQFRLANPEQPVYAYVDGQKLWRVFENLIGNILKYSLEHTRAYVTIKAINGEAVITFKNISKYELSDDVNELFERFKRGDKSRHTEGSGLGLAIAKSIIDLHEGSLDIDVDGDLFKVTIELVLLQE